MSPGRSLRSCLAGVTLLAAAWAGAEEPVRQWQALPVEGGVEAIARAAGLEPGLPAWRVLYEACRRLRGSGGGVEDAGAGGAPAAPKDAVVPLPLAPAFWRRLLKGGDAVTDGGLALAILADRRAMLFYRGLAGFDEETLEALAAEPDALRRIERRNGDAFAAFASRFAVRAGVVLVPGGSEAEPAWQAIVGASPRSPVAFLTKLLERGDGRLAFLYDSIARLEPERQRLVLGLPSSPGKDPAEPLRSLVAVFGSEAVWWRYGQGSFARPDADAARVMRELRLAEGGGIAPPASQAFWTALFEHKPTTAEAIAAAPRVDIAWLAAQIGSGDRARRSLRLEQLAFAQRVFGAAAEASPAEAIQALEGLADARALVLALERLGATDPAFFAAAVAGARSALAFPDHEDLARAHAGLQGALGVIDRARFSGVLDARESERLVRSLLQVPLPAGVPWQHGLAGWVEAALVPALAAAVGGDAADPDRVLLRAMAGESASRRASPVFDWEGLWYRAEPERAERARLEGVRRRQGGKTLRETLRECRAATESERNLCAGALGRVLTSLVYAIHLGDPDGAPLRGEDPARRHAFLPDPWALPTEVSGPGVPWHVTGSLLGLETALGRLSLRRLDPDALPDRAPLVDPAQRRSLAVSVGLANPAELRDTDQHVLATAVAAGRRRALALRPGSADLAGVVRDAGLDPWRARGLAWLLEHEASALPGFFSLGELAYLGQPSGGRWDGWGAADPSVWGLRLRLRPPRPLDESAGRTPEPALAESFVDLGVRVAVHLSQRGLPAELAPAVESRLLGDLFMEARPVGPDDRLALDAWTRQQTAARLDDAVAALVGRGPLQAAPAPGRAR